MIKIGVDAMGGDFAPKETVEGVNIAIKNNKDINIVLYGNEDEIKQYLLPNERISIIHTTEYVSMGEKDPISVVRNNKTASIILAMNDLKNNKIDAVVSSGPTQVLVVCGYLIVKRVSFMRRIALAPIIPSLNSPAKIVLDTGGNLSLDPSDLVDFAIYAQTLVRKMLNITNPKCALLNIGTEEGKGREVDKEAYKLLKACDKIDFIGNIESKDILTTEADIILQDGWSNNIAIKAIEGTAKALGNELKKEFKSSLGGMIGYLFARRNMKRFKDKFNTSKVGGATILGLNGIVVKSHGSSNREAFSNAIIQASNLVKTGLLKEVEKELQ